jgi:hypothetical protein
MIMYKWIVALTVIIFLGDPSLSILGQVGEMRDYVAAFVLSLVAVPWVVSQLDE